MIKQVSNIAKLMRGQVHRGVSDPLTAPVVDDTWVRETTVGTDTVAPMNVTITVPAGEEWRIDSVRVDYITGPAGGLRRIQLFIETPAVVQVFRAYASVTQAFSTTRFYYFAPYVADLAAFRDGDFLTTPIPYLEIETGWRIFVQDGNAAGVDDMTVTVVHGTRLIG